ncbi:hypothetical protein PHLGIDRAFT_88764 [Phlebiopsis gigantea 11061_1 CR5-6]|uniref:homogentisate 1,2-dioxygenase n=1 Tax=Phlebiopsis gigantea (strain 11061_1 CR5-6) TaxID=745531 RepID=A0A0C3SBJ3_PHLG1|nr:hypothetical protein PHLGIDRAFT_88764 [Phlebiopsis gigantea 11061_1 CR5-6]
MPTAAGGYSVARGKGDPYSYQVGFGNYFASEALPNVLPIGQNNPQKVKYDLYTEGINGTPFTVPRAQNQHSWFYRIRPSVAHNGFVKADKQNPHLVAEFSLSSPNQHVSPTQHAWTPHSPPASEKVSFVHSLKTMLGNGGPMSSEGIAIHLYACNADMVQEAFVNSDGDFLIVPVHGRLDIQTEFGKMMVFPGEIAVVQRGLKWKVTLPDGKADGYIQEIFGSHYALPELGPLGASGLANIRDFEHPIAHFDIDQTPWNVTYKLGGQLFTCNQEHTPFDVVAWHGNYVPYKYDLDAFIAVGSISKDHSDPSIFTVLTAPSKTPGVALADFAIFKERWDVADGTFRPPYFHRNTASEVLGLIKGVYEGRSDGFTPGALSYETGFCPHGVSGEVFTAASEGELKPSKVQEGTLMVLFESSMMLAVTDYAINTDKRHDHEPSMWNSLDAKFMKYKDQISLKL